MDRARVRITGTGTCIMYQICHGMHDVKGWLAEWEIAEAGRAILLELVATLLVFISLLGDLWTHMIVHKKFPQSEKAALESF